MIDIGGTHLNLAIQQYVCQRTSADVISTRKHHAGCRATREAATVW
jgi:hypothetical protein